MVTWSTPKSMPTVMAVMAWSSVRSKAFMMKSLQHTSDGLNTTRCCQTTLLGACCTLQPCVLKTQHPCIAALCSLHDTQACPAHACKECGGEQAAPGVVVGHSEGPVKAGLVVDVLEGHVQLLEVVLCTGKASRVMSMPSIFSSKLFLCVRWPVLGNVDGCSFLRRIKQNAAQQAYCHSQEITRWVAMLSNTDSVKTAYHAT